MTEQPYVLASMNQPVRIALFGGFTVTVEGQTALPFRSNKVRALLAYLLLAQPQPLLRTTLSTLLWSDYAPLSAQTNLRQALANLRTVFAPIELFQADRSHVRVVLDPATVWCDVHQFQELLAACQQHKHRNLHQCALCQERLQQAMTLYQGALLAHFPDVDSPLFTRWLQTQRAALAEQWAEAKASLATPMPRRGNLPAPLTPLIGRAQELAELVPRLRHTIYRCLSLVGPGGIGKTRLACAVGEQVQADFPDGVWVVPLGALAPTTAVEPADQLHDRMATAIALTIGCTLNGTAHPTAQVVNYLADKALLLILDSFEHLTTAAAWFPTLLTAAPRLRLLVTSRHRLPLQSQLAYPVGGLGVPPEQPTTGLSVTHLIAQYASLQLFVERAESAQVSISWDASTVAIVNRLCRFVEGSPWAIEVAVSMLVQHTPATLLNAIQQNYRTLSTPLLDLPARQRSAESVFLTAWALLSPSEAQILARCAVFRGGFTLAAAQQVAAATLAILETLVHKSLLQHRGAERYAMHDLVRQFAGEQLAQEATAHETYAVHAAYFMALLATWQPDDTAIKRFRAAMMQERDNVQAAWTWAMETGAIALLQQGLEGLAEFYNLVHLFLEADAVLGSTIDRIRLQLNAQRAANTTAADHRALQALLAHLLWRHCYVLNSALADTERALPLAQELLALAGDLNDNALAARGYYELSVVAYYQGDFHRQEGLLLQALPLVQQYGTVQDQVLCLNLLGSLYSDQHEPAAALHYFQQALAQVGGYANYELMIFNNIGALQVSTGHLTAAAASFQASLDKAVAFGFQSTIAFVVASLGEIALLVGDYAAALPRLLEAHQLYTDMHDYALQAQILSMVCMCYAESGDSATALSYCQRTLASAGGHLYVVQHNILCMLGHLYRWQGRWDDAAAVYQQALTLSQDLNQRADVLLAQTYWAAAILGQGDRPAALATVEPLLATFATTFFMPQQRPQALLLIAYHILVANADPRAEAVLQQVWDYVKAQAAKIEDPRLRHTFLTNVPVNRELAQLIGKPVEAEESSKPLL